MDGQGLAIAGSIAIEEHLRASCISSAPSEEIHCNANRFLGLATDVPGQHRHAETLCCPEGKDYPVADEETGAGGMVLVFYSHDNNSANEGAVQIVSKVS